MHRCEESWARSIPTDATRLPRRKNRYNYDQKRQPLWPGHRSGCFHIARTESSGINVICENDNIDTTQEDSKLVITITSAVAQANNELRRKNIQWGMSKRAESGTSGFYHRRCYGYGHDENENW